MPGADQPATVIVTLRLADGVFHMRPSQLLEEWAWDAGVLAGFTANADGEPLLDIQEHLISSLGSRRDRVVG